MDAHTWYGALQELAARQSNGVSTPDRMTVMGTTNPFFLKSLKSWPNALVFPFLEPKPKDAQPSSPKTRARLSSAGSLDELTGGGGCVSVRLKPTVHLDTVEESARAVLLRRRGRYVVPDATVLTQLVTPPEVYVTQTANAEEEPYVTINNAILRQHFRNLTRSFLRPFDQYFGIWQSSGSTNSNLYMSVEDSLKPFNLKQFLASINIRKLPASIRRSKWQSLYTAFVKSSHFEPWFAFRRKQCVYQFTQTLRALRVDVAPEVLITAPNGGSLTLEQCQHQEKAILRALEAEEATYTGDDVDHAQIDAIKHHLAALQQRIHKLQNKWIVS